MTMPPTETEFDGLLTVQEVSEWTGLAVGTIYHFVSQHRIPVVRLSKRCIRFRYSDLLDWIRTRNTRSNETSIKAKYRSNERIDKCTFL